MEMAAAAIFLVLLGFYVYFKVKKFRAYGSQSTAGQPESEESDTQNSEE